MEATRNKRWQDWLNLALGAWLFVMPFFGVVHLGSAAGMNVILFGSVIAVISVAALVREQSWEEWINVAIGLWLIVAPFVLGFTLGGVAMWSSVIIGLFIAGDALWAALTARPVDPTHSVSHKA
jgi:hypothetical protein